VFSAVFQVSDKQHIPILSRDKALGQFLAYTTKTKNATMRSVIAGASLVIASPLFALAVAIAESPRDLLPAGFASAGCLVLGLCFLLCGRDKPSS